MNALPSATAHAYSPPTFPPPATFLFANASKERLDQVLRGHNLQPEQWVEWINLYICLAVNTGEHRVLVDTGADALGPNTGRLLQNMQAEGIAPGDIDTVILTHGHPDHIGGDTDAEGNQLFPTPTTLCGETNGIFGPQNGQKWNLTNTC